MLHLLDCDADYQLRSMAIAVAGDQAVTVGRGGRLRDAWVAARFLRGHDGPIHAWGNRPLVAAAIAAKRHPIVFTTPSEMSRAAWARVAWIARKRDITVICPGQAERNALCARGVAPDRCHWIAPGVESAATNRGWRDQMRWDLRIEPTDFVVLAAGETTRAAEHELGLWAAAIAHELNPSVKLLAWGHGPMWEKLRRMARVMDHPMLLKVGRRWDFTALAAAADAAIYTGRGGQTLGLAVCMAAGLPLVRAESNRAPSVMTRKLIDLRNDPAGHAELGEKEKAQAKKLFGMERLLESYRRIYTPLGEEHAIERRATVSSDGLTRPAPVGWA